MYFVPDSHLVGSVIPTSGSSMFWTSQHLHLRFVSRFINVDRFVHGLAYLFRIGLR